MSTPSAEPTGRRPDAGADVAVLDRWLLRALAVLNGVFLAVLGLAAGIVAGLSASWSAWLWLTGPVGQVLGAAAVALFLAVLFLGVRALGWAVGARWGPTAFTLGWVAASLALTGLSFGGDVVLSAAATNYLFLYGGVAAVVLATVLAPPSARPLTTRAGSSTGPSSGRPPPPRPGRTGRTPRP